MAEQALSTPVPAAHKPTASRCVRRLCAAPDHGTCDHPCLGDRGSSLRSGLRRKAERRAACDSASVIIDPAFLQALGSTLSAVAEGLAITLVIGTVYRTAHGTQPHIRSGIPRLHQWL